MRERAAVAALLGLFCALAFNAARLSSATWDEPAHLAAGYSYLAWGDFRLNPEHPPLIKQLAALPLLAMTVWPARVSGARDDDSASLHNLRRFWQLALSDERAQWLFAHQFLYGLSDAALARYGVARGSMVPTTVRLSKSDYHNDADALLLAARVPMILLGAALGLLVFLWSRELFGSAGGLLSLTLYCFDPNFLAHSGLVTTDVGFALFFSASIYFLYRASRRPGPAELAGVALSFALACVTKYSAVLLVPILILLGARLPARRLAALLGACALCAWVGIWSSYGFRFEAVKPWWTAASEASEALPMQGVLERTDAAGGGRLGTTALRLAHRARLLPEAYLYGAAYARLRSYERESYLLGRMSSDGFAHYFLIAFLVKTPLAALAAFLAGGWAAWRRRRALRAPLIFLLAPVFIYGAFALLSKLNIGHRHLLPLYPPLFVLAGALALPWREKDAATRRRLASAAFAAIALAPFVVFSPPWKPAAVYPHLLAYFNELGGGPRHGHRILVDSNLDWGQELKGLARWLSARGISEPINLCYFGTADPRYHGIPHLNLTGCTLFEPHVPLEQARRPGLLAISASHREGAYARGVAPWTQLLEGAELVDAVGHSIFVYRLR